MYAESSSTTTDDGVVGAPYYGTADTALPPAGAGLSIALPRFQENVFDGIYDRLTEAYLAYDPLERNRVGCWLLFAHSAGLVSERAIDKAFCSATPCTSLDRVVHRSFESLSKHLEGKVREVCPKPPSYSSIAVALDAEATSLSVSFQSIYYISVSSLRLVVPEMLSAMVYEAFHLIGMTLVPCRLPHETISGDCSWHIQESMHEYRDLVKAGMAEDMEKAAEYVQKRAEAGEFEFLANSSNLPELIAILKDADQGPPKWMSTFTTDKNPVIRRQRLARRLSAWLRWHKDFAEHPWVRYVQTVINVLQREFPDRKSWKESQASFTALHINDPFDGEMHISNGILLSTETPIEGYISEDIEQEMMNTGELPVMHLSLSPNPDLADSGVGRILDQIALGVGLLLQADHINAELRSSCVEK